MVPRTRKVTRNPAQAERNLPNPETSLPIEKSKKGPIKNIKPIYKNDFPNISTNSKRTGDAIVGSLLWQVKGSL
jgi:hypothetical protein